MATSQNGYPANDRSYITNYLVGGKTKFALRKGPTGWLLAHFATWFDDNIRDIDAGAVMDDWSYAERPIRGSTTTLSNHASGTAIDVDATRWPLGVQPEAYLTKAEITAVRQQLAEYEGAIRWGGDYTGRKDPMHFEINKPEDFCARIQAKLQSSTSPTSPLPPTSEEDDMFDTNRDRATIENTKYAVVDLLKPVVDALLSIVLEEDAQTDRIEYMLGDASNGVRVQLARIEARQLVEDAIATAGPGGVTTAQVSQIVDDAVTRNLAALGDQLTAAAEARKAKIETVAALAESVAAAADKLAATSTAA